MSIDPSTLSLPSPRASPAPSSPITPLNAGPSRKRPRADASPEDRKEARAHRNRIAAQNSRDRRKAQFSYLEHRVAELEEENRQLRAGLASVTAAAQHPSSTSPVDTPSARDKENEELRERIRTLEKGWDAVVKALQAQGLPTGLPTPQTSTSASPPSPSADSSSSTPHSTTAFPVLVPPPVSLPISPAPSHSSLSPSSIFDEFEFDSTRHLARVATTDLPSVSLQQVVSQRPVNKGSTQPLLSRTLLRSLRRPPRSSMTWQWKRSSVKSSRLPLPCRRRLFLLTQPPPQSRRHQWPPPRRR